MPSLPIAAKYDFAKVCAHCGEWFTTGTRTARYCSERCSLTARYERYVIRRGSGECWGWTGGKNKGYGTLRGFSAASTDRAHRISYLLHVGPIPDGLTVLHSCDNRECTNPRHLSLGTNGDNNADCRAKGRHAHGEKVGGAKLTESKVREIRSLRSGGMSVREVARVIGANFNTVQCVCRGRTWRHVQ